MNKKIVSGCILSTTLLILLSIAPTIYANESELPEQSQSQLLASIHKEFWRNPSIRKILFDSSKILQLHSQTFREDMGDIHLTPYQLARILRLLFAFNTVDLSDIHSQISYSDEITVTYEQVFDGVDENQMAELSDRFMTVLHPQFEEISAIISQNIGFDVTAFEWDFPIICTVLLFMVNFWTGILYLYFDFLSVIVKLLPLKIAEIIDLIIFTPLFFIYTLIVLPYGIICFEIY